MARQCTDLGQCRDVAIGWRLKSGTIENNYDIIIDPVTVSHFFEVWVIGQRLTNFYKLLVNNTIIRDKFELAFDEKHQYFNGLLYPGETLKMVAGGRISYNLRWIQKSY